MCRSFAAFGVLGWASLMSVVDILAIVRDAQFSALVRKELTMKKIDDGFAPELVWCADFDGVWEIPVIHKERLFLQPFLMRPFSRRGATAMPDEYICFYEHDKKFASLLENAGEYLDSIRKFAGIVSPDCSLYRDMPLVLQVMNTYLNRAVGHFFQFNGMTVIPNLRWGDERSYRGVPGRIEPFAFKGVERGSVVSVGTYGCITGDENRFYFHDGLGEMLNVVGPEKVLVYGRMPAEIFGDFAEHVEFVRYEDWTTIRKGGR